MVFESALVVAGLVGGAYAGWVGRGLSDGKRKVSEAVEKRARRKAGGAKAAATRKEKAEKAAAALAVGQPTNLGMAQAQQFQGQNKPSEAFARGVSGNGVYGSIAGMPSVDDSLYGRGEHQ